MQGVRLSRLVCRRVQMGQDSTAKAKREKRPHYHWCVADRAIRPEYDNQAPPAIEGHSVAQPTATRARECA